VLPGVVVWLFVDQSGVHALRRVAEGSIAIGIVLGLLIGKPLDIWLATMTERG
jgi:Na+/H+ antiporter NhaA